MNGLVGKQLTHSLSPLIHNYFGYPNYQLIETQDIAAFLQQKNFEMVNITIPYKEMVLPFLDVIDPLAKEIGAVNTIIHKNNQLYGYNTDYIGLLSALDSLHLSLKNQRVVITGNGGMAKCAHILCLHEHAYSIHHLVRTKKDHFDVSFDEIASLQQTTVLIQTTPVGMYPMLNETLPFSLHQFPHLIGMIETIYNPYRTDLLIQASQLRIPSTNGLHQLVVQAKQARELADQRIIPQELITKVLQAVRKVTLNVVLIGLPMSGKSSIGKLLATRWNKSWIDTDQAIEEIQHKTIDEIFDLLGEQSFRQMELDYALSIQHLKNTIISTGGGMIEQIPLINALKRNGILIYLEKQPVQTKGLDMTGRPLLKFPEAMFKLHEKRAPLYQKHADIIINANQPYEQILREIEEKFDEITRFRRS
jgi:shikimate dehydrogenase